MRSGTFDGLSGRTSSSLAATSTRSTSLLGLLTLSLTDFWRYGGKRTEVLSSISRSFLTPLVSELVSRDPKVSLNFFSADRSPTRCSMALLSEAASGVDKTSSFTTSAKKRASILSPAGEAREVDDAAASPERSSASKSSSSLSPSALLTKDVASSPTVSSISGFSLPLPPPNKLLLDSRRSTDSLSLVLPFTMPLSYGLASTKAIVSAPELSFVDRSIDSPSGAPSTPPNSFGLLVLKAPHPTLPKDSAPLPTFFPTNHATFPVDPTTDAATPSAVFAPVSGGGAGGSSRPVSTNTLVFTPFAAAPASSAAFFTFEGTARTAVVVASTFFVTSSTAVCTSSTFFSTREGIDFMSSTVRATLDGTDFAARTADSTADAAVEERACAAFGASATALTAPLTPSAVP
mmetsp:Transcript_13682/g.27306  ORF Transcript_13682/g.27306 Transcript_13682/m.27306 type:complete len:405 (-) Transcript_13682:961-2175(-)